MNDDYLWDRTGEPDPEIQQLEDVLGTLRYQPQPLAIPEQQENSRKQSHFSQFAIAAALTVMLFGAAWWILLTSRRAADSAKVHPATTATAADPESVASIKAISSSDQAMRSIENGKRAQPPRHRVTQTVLTRNVKHSNGAAPLGTPPSPGRSQVVKSYEAITRERAEAEAAKEQLLLALRVVSAKLSLAQKRAQGTYPANMIRNQHKLG